MNSLQPGYCIIGSDQIVVDGKDSLDAVSYEIRMAFLTEEFQYFFIVVLRCD